MSVTNLTFCVGGLAVVTGASAFVVSGASSATALIPAGLGVLLLVAAAISRNETAHRHAIHAALTVALVGIAGTLMNVLQLGELLAGTAERPLAVAASTVTFVLLSIYLGVGIVSFVRARRARRA